MREENYRREKEKGNGIGTRKKNYNKWHKNCSLSPFASHIYRWCYNGFCVLHVFEAVMICANREFQRNVQCGQQQQ